jgi:hypothetical protein
MACGTGICRSCVVPRDARGPKPRKGQNAAYLIACLEGPVVPASCIDWARDRATAAPYGENALDALLAAEAVVAEDR